MTNALWRAPSCWYFVVAALFVVFHVGRGALGQTFANKAVIQNIKPWQAAWLIYAPDALLHLCCTVFGFVCLLLVYRLAECGGTSELAALVLLAVVGLAGATGQLAVALSLGNFPTLK
ncbi:MAG TPA: hypothetical protein VMU40_07645 [Steroidobacteraceae bacterium]|nr:hypothetical protein [Steroidobacteraceae bacterium]